MIMEEWLKQGFHLYPILGLCIIGMIVRIMVSGFYRSLIQAADEMGNSSNPLMKTLKLKYEMCYQLEMGVNNVDIFVDKYLFRHKIYGLHLYTWENLPNQIMVVLMLYSTVVGFMSIGMSTERMMVLVTWCVGILACGILILLDYTAHIPVKRQLLCVNIRDHLENIMLPRFEKEARMMGRAENSREQKKQQVEKDRLRQETSKESIPDTIPFQISTEEKALIEEVLNEYMV